MRKVTVNRWTISSERASILFFLFQLNCDTMYQYIFNSCLAYRVLQSKLDPKIHHWIALEFPSLICSRNPTKPGRVSRDFDSQKRKKKNALENLPDTSRS